MSPAIALVGEAYGAEEDRLKHPFVGPSGRELARMCQEAGILPAGRIPFDPRDMRDFWLTQDRVSLHNTLNLRPPSNDIEQLCTSKAGDTSGLPPLKPGKYLRGEFLGEVSRLFQELVEAKPNVVVLLGNTPAWAILGQSGISKIRGAVTYSRKIDRKCLPTFHPAAVLRQWELRATTIFDLAKAGRESGFPEVRRPERTIYIEPSLSDVRSFSRAKIEGCDLLSFDIETRGNQITCIGFAPSPREALVIPFVDQRKLDANYWPTKHEELEAWSLVRQVLDLPMPKLAQNGLYDIQFLWRSVGIPVRNFLHDTMLLHHALQPEAKKGLGFLGSVYTNEASWKIMRHDTIKRDE